MKNSADLLDLQNSSYPTQPHSIIAKLSYKYDTGKDIYSYLIVEVVSAQILRFCGSSVSMRKCSLQKCW